MVSADNLTPNLPQSKNQDAISEELEGYSVTKSSSNKSFVKSFNAILGENIRVYPGMIVQGEFLKKGNIVDIGNFPRKHIVLTTQGLVDTVYSPDYTSVELGLRRLKNGMDTSKIQAKFVYVKSDVLNIRKALDSINAGAEWLLADINASLNLEKSTMKSAVLLCFKQTYYSVGVNDVRGAGSLFDDKTNIWDLGTRIYPGNPPCYITQVDYGRLILVKVTSSVSQTMLEAAIDGHYLQYTGGYKNKQQTFGIASTFEAIVIGGSAKGGTKPLLTKDIQDVDSLIFSEANQFENAVPINYSLRYLVDNEPVALQKIINYQEQKTYLDPSKYQVLDFYFDNIKIDAIPQQIFVDRPFYYEITVRDNQNNILKTLDGEPAIHTLSRSDVLDFTSSKKYNYQVGDTISLQRYILGVICPKGEENHIAIDAKMFDIKSDIAKVGEKFIDGIKKAVPVVGLVGVGGTPKAEDFVVGFIKKLFISPYNSLPETFIEDTFLEGTSGYDVKLRYRVSKR